VDVTRFARMAAERGCGHEQDVMNDWHPAMLVAAVGLDRHFYTVHSSDCEDDVRRCSSIVSCCQIFSLPLGGRIVELGGRNLELRATMVRNSATLVVD